MITPDRMANMWTTGRWDQIVPDTPLITSQDPPRRAPEIPNQLNHLGDSMGRLCACVDALAKKLIPSVCGSQEPQPLCDQSKPDCRSTIGQQLSNYAESIDELCRQLEWLAQNVEVD